MKRTISITAFLALALGGCGDDTADPETAAPEATAPATSTAEAVDIGGGLSVGEPRVRVLPGDGPAAGYMRLRNDGAATAALAGAASSAFGHAMLHRSVERDGEWSMRPVEGALEIAPGETLVFEPQGLHLMLMQPSATLEPGDAVTIKLKFADGAEREVDFDVVGVMEEPR